MGRTPNSPGSPTDPLQQGLLGMYGMAAEIGDLLKSLGGTVDAMNKKLGDVGKGAAGNLEGAAKKAVAFRKEIEHLSSEYTWLASQSATIEEHMKGFLDIQKQLTRAGIKASSYEDALEALTLMEKQAKKLLDSQVLSGKAVEEVQRQYAAVSRQIEKTKGHQKANNPFSPDDMEDFSRVASKAYTTITKLVASSKGVNFSSWSKDLHAAEKSFSSLFGQSSRMDKFRKHGQTAHDIQQARKERSEGRVGTFTEKLSRVREEQRAHLQEGSYDVLAQPTRDSYRRAARSMVSGPLESRVLERHLRGDSGFITRTGMSLMQEGEGSIMGGTVSKVAGMVEGGAAGALGIVAELAPILAVLDVIKNVFDSRMVDNKKISETLGKGGLFGAGGSGSDDPILRLDNVHKTLNTESLASPFAGLKFGIGHEKNLSIMQAMVSSGMGISNLADTPSRLDKNGFSQGSFGTFQRNAYAYGKLPGFSPEEATADTIKLMGQYRQSLAGTEKFFVTVAKDVQAAGITTSKYISILDDVNSHFDSTNKLLGTTVDVMKLLSRTGRMTAEDLKDMMDVATNGGKKLSLPVSAFLNQRSMHNGEMQARLDSQKTAYEDALQAVADATGTDIGDIQKGVQENGRNYLDITLQNQARHKFAGNPQELQSSSGAISAAGAQFDTMTAIQNAMPTASNPNGDPTGLALYDDHQKGNISTRMFQTAEALNQALSNSMIGNRQANISDLFNGNRDAVLKNPVTKGLMDTEGLQNGLSDYTRLIQSISQGKLLAFQDGSKDTDTSLDTVQRRRMATEAASFMKGRKGFESFDFKDKDVVRAMQKFATGGESNEETLLSGFQEMPKTFQDFAPISSLTRDKPKMEQALDAAAGIKQVTTTTGDILQTTWEGWFKSLSDPLGDIVRAVNTVFGFLGGGTKGPRYSGIPTGAKSGLDMTQFPQVSLDQWAAGALAPPDNVTAKGSAPVEHSLPSVSAVDAVAQAAGTASVSNVLGKVAPLAFNTGIPGSLTGGGVSNSYVTYTFNTADATVVAPSQTLNRPVNNAGSQTPLQKKGPGQ